VIEQLEPAAPPAIDPERADYLRRTMLAVASRLLEQMLTEIGAGSTDGGSFTDRAMVRVLTPWLPKLRALFLAKLSEAEPESIERVMGAFATAIESILAQAPGAPLPRHYVDWDADGRLVLVPFPEPTDA